ncbi:MAG: ABC transporter substrate-binding protein [Promethearchaeota archaeon]
MTDRSKDSFLNSLICIAIVVNSIVFSTLSIFLYSGPFDNDYVPYPGEVLKVARTSNPVTMDPMDSWDSVSNDMLDQVVETLIAYDFSDPDLPLVGRLAEDWDFASTQHGTNITFTLRQNVYFHDGELFTGEDVIHTFERINYFGNWTGTLDPNIYTQASPHFLYKFGDGTPIFNDTLSRAWWNAHNTSDPYTVMLFLNAPFAPFEGLIAYTASAIVGHTSTPKYEMLDPSEDLVIGTGPFKLVRYIPNSEIRFARWERYWRTGAYWGQIVYVYYRDAVTANNAMLALDIDYLGQGLASLKPYFELDPDIIVTGDGINPYINGSIYWYLAFNSICINITWRKAISHAFNYSYLIHDIDEGTKVKANSLVPSGFPAHNSSTRGADYNIPIARTFMQSMGFGVGWDVGTMHGDIFTPGANETLWTSAQFIPDIGNFSNNQWNFRHRQGSHFMVLLIQRFTEDMDLIGVDVVPQILTWDQFIRMGQLHPERLHIYYLGYGPDYFETFNMIDPLVNNASASNFARINDPHLQDLLEQTVAETNTTARYILYQRLQGYIIDVQYYHMPLEYDKIYFTHVANLKGFPYNCMRNLYWYPTYRA